MGGNGPSIEVPGLIYRERQSSPALKGSMQDRLRVFKLPFTISKSLILAYWPGSRKNRRRVCVRQNTKSTDSLSEPVPLGETGE